MESIYLYLILFYLVLNILSFSSYSSNEWYKDTSNEEEFANKCDFPIIEFSTLLNNSHIKTSFNYPYIIRNGIVDWPAFKKWGKENFIELFGNRTIRSGSESSIVHSGGIAESEMTIENMINQMNNKENKNYFVFDTTILSTIPELMNDINIPEIFQGWDNKEQENAELLWHMLSLGPSKTGLPFHNHGKTWLAVIHGIKQWYIYPPGYDTPTSIDLIYNPLLPISTWLEEIYPKFTNYSKPPLITYHDVMNNELTYDEYHIESNKHDGYRPLECNQLPGDLIFIPSRWVHLTVNQGETIAIGGQETLFDNDRYNNARKVLENHPNNYEAWKDLGLAQSNMATSEYSYIRTLTEPYIVPNSNHNLLSMNGMNAIQVLDELLLKTRDTWMILYYDSSNLNHNLDDVIHHWIELANQVNGIVNIAIIDLNAIITDIKQQKPIKQVVQYQAEISIDENGMSTSSSTILEESASAIESYTLVIDPIHEFKYLPMIKVHRGDQLEQRYDPDYQGVPYLIHDILDIDSILRYLKGSIEVDQLALGSITKGCVGIKRKYHEALLNLKHASSIKPLQMELLSMINDVAGLAHDLSTMHEAVVNGLYLLDQLYTNNNDRIPAMTFASMYHKLARSYISLNMAEHAQPLIQQSLDIMPTFIPSMKDIISVYLLQHNKILAQDALEQLKKVSIHLYYNNNEDIQYYQSEINKLD